MGNNGRVTVNTNQLIADGLEFDFDKQITGLQIWNVILKELGSLGIVGSLKHDLYPIGFTGVILFMDGHAAAQYTPGQLTLTLCSNQGSSQHEIIRAHLYETLENIEP